MKRVLLGVLGALFFGHSPVVAGILDYGLGNADARVPFGKDAFNIWIGGNRTSFMIEPAWKSILGGGGHFPDAVWRMVAEAFVAPVGCGISDVHPFSRMGAAWKAMYVCPAGVDLPALVKAQHAQLKQGDPLQSVPPSDPSATPKAKPSVS